MKEKILIVEDEILIAEDIKETLISLGFNDVLMAHDKTEAFQLIDVMHPNIVLLDVRLENERDGIDIGKKLAERKDIQFIYVTAHSDVNMVKEIIRTNPAGYITKPVKKSDLYASISLALSKLETPDEGEKMVNIKDGYDTVLVLIKDIIYIEAEGNYLTLFCQDKKHVIRLSMEQFINDADSSLLFRVHRSFAINIQQVVRYSKKEIVMTNAETIPISRNIKDDFHAFMANQIKS
jgi:DNA-binding LytR/AlgR family response regulator